MADIVVIGGGHAGCEAALASARMGVDTLMLTLNLDGIALMACNPSIGGSAKGQIVREVDALGGEMGLAIDDTMLQSRTLNLSKGPAVHALRAQADKQAYQNRMRKALFTQPHLRVEQGEAVEIVTEDGAVCGVVTRTGKQIPCKAVVVATGVYLKGRVIIGEAEWMSGPQGLQNSQFLSESLLRLGFQLRRFKTGTPARIDVRSIDFDEMEPQYGDEPVEPFSYLTDRKLENTFACYLTWTNEETHRIIRDNLSRAPMYTGSITGIGPRYCPSIETKIVRFADKTRHQIFMEPEGASSHEWYVQGMSTSLPEDVQWSMYRSIAGLHHCEITRLGYAIEYDCIDSRELRPSLECLRWKNLFMAGQINGTSGYEEAAGQGILCGINAALQVQGREPLVLTRDMAYIGVLTDDLTTRGTDEPYRMMTSRAEHRLHLRQDNADRRLTRLSYALGLAGKERLERMEAKQAAAQALMHALHDTHFVQSAMRSQWLEKHHQPDPPQTLSAEELLRRPEISLTDLGEMDAALCDCEKPVRDMAEIETKYAGYLVKQQAMIRKARAMEDTLLPEDMDYLSMDALRLEARDKLQKQRPRSLAQAGRIPGVSPADVAVLMVALKKRQESPAGEKEKAHE
ncbi:MAG: tRNA uridine-5-carboxymethylaminomethyl(34) synthesis enzyme MnmG [Clostridia bacterium]|nr:tRNA uridine-5-carboxymethylaminomethyl(34) synthesis enzyme MnmG [Clostridia bacterium]